MAAAGFVTPVIVSDATAFASSAHVPPLFASVTVTTEPTADPVAEQLENPAPTVTVGDATVNEGWNVTLIVPAAASAPLGPAVNPTVHVDAEVAVSGAPVKVTPPTPEVIVIADATTAAVLSRLVATANPAAG